MPDQNSGCGGIPDPSAIRTRRDFASALTLLRERVGLTVRDVARMTGIPASTVGGYTGGQHLPPIKPPGTLQKLLTACGVTDAVEVELWLAALSRVRRAPGKRPADAPVPYRGLASFQPGDAEWFHGRDRLVSVLINHLQDQCSVGGLVAAVGPSGCGKSSLLRAGLIPAVQSRALMSQPGSENWPVVLLTPGPHPVHTLAMHLSPLTGQDPAQLATELLSAPSAAAEFLASSGAHGAILAEHGEGGHNLAPWRVVVVVDQLEEVFTACHEETERQAFISALCSAAGVVGVDRLCGPHALVIVGLRADFYGHALNYPELVPGLQARQVLVGPMTEVELRSAIMEPARRAKVEIEDGLVEVLLRDLSPAAGNGGSCAAHDAGALPHLSHALLTTWKRSRRSRLTVADYRDSGGVHGAVARTAEHVYGELTEAQQHLARQIFLRLVHVSDDMADTRRRASRQELLLSGDDVQHVLSLFVDHRLITVATDEVEIAHEALLSAWPRLREWTDADRSGARVHRQLSGAAEIWRESGRDPGTLYRGGRLTVAAEWANAVGHQAGLNQLERSFLDASLDHETAEARTSRRRTRRLQGLAAALAALSLIAGFLTVFAFRQQAAAASQRDQAASRQVAVEADQLRTTDVNLAMQLSLAAYRIYPTVEARSSLLESYTTPAVTRVLGPPGVMQCIAFSRGSDIMAAAGQDAQIRLWNTADPGHPTVLGHPLMGHTSTIFSLAFSPDGRILASGSEDHTIRLWDVVNPAEPRLWGPPLTGPANTVYSVAFSPDGHLLAAGSADNTVWLWDVADPRNPLPLGAPLKGPDGYVQSVAFSPNGHLVAAGSADHTVWVWNITNPRHPMLAGPPLKGASDTILSVAFSPDGSTLAAGSEDNKVQLWDLIDPHHPARDGPPLTGPTSWIQSVTFSPDGTRLAAASSDSNVWVWNLVSRHAVAILPQPAPVTDVTFWHGDNTLATSGGDGIARFWTIPGPMIATGTGPIWATPVAHDHVLTIATAGNTAQLWNVSNPRQPIPIGPVLTDDTRTAQASGAAALSPNGETLAAGAANGTTQLWDVRNSAKPKPLSQLSGPTNVEQETFSTDGRMLAITGDAGTTWLWETVDPDHPVPLSKPLGGLASYGISVAFSPNGHLLAVGSADKLVHLWNITNPRSPVPLKSLKGAASTVYSVAFSPNGRILAAGSADDKVRLWNVANPHHISQIGSPLSGPTDYVYSVAFSPDGRTLAAGVGGPRSGSVWLWDLTPAWQPTLVATFAEPSGSVLTASFLGRPNMLVSGSRSGLVRLWDTSTSQVTRFICSKAGNQITRSEWKQYIPGIPYRPPC